MAATPTPMLNELLISLAYKLRDPVKMAGEDGKIFFYKSRINYISRAYASLKRKLESVLLNVEDYFPDFYLPVDVEPTTATLLKNFSVSLKTLYGANITQTAFGIFSIFGDLKKQVLTQEVGQTVIEGTEGTASETFSRQIIKISPENYFQGLYDPASKFYKENEENKKYYFAIINGQIKFLAGLTTYVEKLHIFSRNYVPEFQVDASVDIMLPVELHDVILNLAAYEAMLDLGNPTAVQKAQLYNQEVAKEIQIIQYKQETMRREDTDRTAK